MNLLTDSLSNCCTFVHGKLCDVPMRLVIDEDQDLHVVRRSDVVYPGFISCSLPPGISRIAVLVALSQMLTGLVAKIELTARQPKAARGGA